jgi:hypothetical protein
MADFEIISEGKLSSAAAEISITSIPATYTHLECVFALRADGGAASGNAYMQLNGDGNSNYGQFGGYVNGNGWSSVTSAAFASRTGSVNYFQSATLAAASGASQPTGIFYVNHIMIPLYSSTTTSTKTMISTSTIGWNNNNNLTEYSAGFYNTTSAINAIKIVALGGVNLDTHSSWWVGGYA